MPEPIYTAANCSNPAYQLLWSYNLFWREDALEEALWLNALTAACAPDDIRILKHRLAEQRTSYFLLSTCPHVSPLTIAQRVKGRLQHMIRPDRPKAFKGKYGLRSIGSTKAAKVRSYVANQIGHHAMADPRVHERFQRYVYENPAIDLAAPRHTTHARYWHHLHIVFVMRDRNMEIRASVQTAMYDGLLRIARAKGHRIASFALLPDHLHIALSCALNESPEDVALGYMNNLAFLQGMKPFFDFGYFAGTFGEYDVGAIR